MTTDTDSSRGKATEQHTCGHCGAQVALMGAHYLDLISEALDSVGAPTKSANGDYHYSIFDRIAALSLIPQTEGSGLAEELARKLAAWRSIPFGSFDFERIRLAANDLANFCDEHGDRLLTALGRTEA